MIAGPVARNRCHGLWRDAGVAERAGLENRCAFTGTEGSNPSLSALVTAREPSPLVRGQLLFQAPGVYPALGEGGLPGAEFL